MRATLANDRYERRRWRRALRMAAKGIPPTRIIEATGIKARTYYWRMAKERALVDLMRELPN